MEAFGQNMKRLSHIIMTLEGHSERLPTLSRGYGKSYEKGNLRVGDTFCSLGVLCDISDVGIWNGGEYLGEISEWDISIEAQGKLAHMNDCGTSFMEIADYIEEHWEQL